MVRKVNFFVSAMNHSFLLLISLSFKILKLANLLKKDAVSAQLSHGIQFGTELKGFCIIYSREEPLELLSVWVK